MKKILSILFALIIILTGMHLSFATHLCGGKVSAVKLSFTHEKAGCGMCSKEQKISTDKEITTESCCKDEMSFLAVDDNYNSSSVQIVQPVNHLLQVFYIPMSVENQFFNSYPSSNANVRPPGEFSTSAVRLPDICIFRI